MIDATNPLLANTSFRSALEIVRGGGCGQLLGIYAVARSRSRLAEPLIELGLPLLHALTDANDAATSVAAVCATAEPDLEHWSIVVPLASGLTLSIDVGAGIGRAQPQEIDLRVEWSGTDRVVLFDPARVAVTIANEFTTQWLSAEVDPIARAFAGYRPQAARLASAPPEGWELASAVADAARRSAALATPIELER